MNHPFDNPEIDKIFETLFDRIFDESERGAVIIGATIVEEYLEEYVKSILPKSSNNYIKRLLDYPGILSSFSAKVELCYAFRLIDSNVYTSILELKDIRNLAAHASTSFKLKDYEDRLNKVFDIGPGMVNSIKIHGIDLMFDIKMKGIDYIAKDYKLSEEDKKKHLRKTLEGPGMTEELMSQSLYWALLVGLTLLCGLIYLSKKGTLKTLNDASTWASLSKDEIK